MRPDALDILSQRKRSRKRVTPLCCDDYRIRRISDTELKVLGTIRVAISEYVPASILKAPGFVFNPRRYRELGHVRQCFAQLNEICHSVKLICPVWLVEPVRRQYRAVHNPVIA